MKYLAFFQYIKKAINTIKYEIFSRTDQFPVGMFISTNSKFDFIIVGHLILSYHFAHAIDS